jgi:hypothetical protein
VVAVAPVAASVPVVVSQSVAVAPASTAAEVFVARPAAEATTAACSPPLDFLAARGSHAVFLEAIAVSRVLRLIVALPHHPRA